MNKDVPFSDAILAGNIRIGKGGFKFLRLSRKAPYKLADILQQSIRFPSFFFSNYREYTVP